MTYGFYAIKSPSDSGDDTKSKVELDPILKGQENDGMRFLWDAAFGFSYPAGPFTGRPAPGAPANLALIGDIAKRADGSFLLPSGAVDYEGGGFDFTNSNALNTGVAAPASVLADIWAAYGGVSQEYLAFQYMRMPATGKWPTSGVASIMGDRSYGTSAGSLITVNMLNTEGYFTAYRQTASSTTESSTYNVVAPTAVGALAQIAIWRNADGQGFQVRTAGAIQKVTKAKGPDNTQNFSANPFVFGRPNAFGGAGVKTFYEDVRCYRGGIINLARWGVDPVTLLAGDWDRVMARVAESALKNGGVSAEFN